MNPSVPIRFSWESVTKGILEVLNMPVLLYHLHKDMVNLSQLFTSHRGESCLGELRRLEPKLGEEQLPEFVVGVGVEPPPSCTLAV